MLAVEGIEEITRLDVLFVEFSEQDQVRKCKIMHHPKNRATKDAATAWLLSR